MSNIPSINEFVNKQSLRNFEFEEGYFIDEEDFRKALQEYAVLHVQAALKAASEKATILKDGTDIGHTGIWEAYDHSKNDVEYTVNKEAILNSYSLTNIK